MDLEAEWAPGGVVSRPALLAAGWTAGRVRGARAVGDLVNLRRGWYATRTAAPEVMRAVSAGGVLTCLSALKFHGVWTPPDNRLHVGYSEHGRRIRRLPPGCCRCAPVAGRPAPVLAVEDPLAALRAAAGCLEEEALVVVMDSLLHQRRLRLDDLREALAGRPAPIPTLVERCAPAESGTETMVRERLRRRTRATLRTQVQIADVGWVDLVVGERLVIEVDSVAHHTSLANYHQDRWRDLRLAQLGYTVARLTYHQVVYQWAEVEPFLLDLLAQSARPRRRVA